MTMGIRVVEVNAGRCPSHRVQAVRLCLAACFVIGLSSAYTTGVATAGPSVECVEEAATETEAVQIAVACGHEVAVVDSFTEWDTQYATPSGRLRIEYGVKAVRTRMSGEWGPIDASVVPSAEGLSVAAPVNPMIFVMGRWGDRWYGSSGMVTT